MRMQPAVPRIRTEAFPHSKASILVLEGQAGEGGRDGCTGWIGRMSKLRIQGRDGQPKREPLQVSEYGVHGRDVPGLQETCEIVSSWTLVVTEPKLPPRITGLTRALVSRSL